MLTVEQRRRFGGLDETDFPSRDGLAAIFKRPSGHDCDSRLFHSAERERNRRPGERVHRDAAVKSAKNYDGLPIEPQLTSSM